MELLKRKYAFLWVILTIFTGSASMLALAGMLDLFEEDAWYTNNKYWIIGLCFFIFPAAIMVGVFIVEMMCKVAAKLEVPGKELYLSPFVWFLFLIVPVLGWIFFITIFLYLEIWIIVAIAKGKAEK